MQFRDHVVEDVNPGEQLRDFLREMYFRPVITENFTENHSHTNKNAEFLENIDKDFLFNGEFISAVYDSSINYMIRRLLVATSGIHKYVEELGLSKDDGTEAAQFTATLREYVENRTRISAEKHELLVILLKDCYEVTRDSISRPDREAVLAHAKDNEPFCYICGTTLNFTEQGKPDSAEVEHVWPKSLGGASKRFNLKIACMTCNKVKRNYINAFDFHYEQICLNEDVALLEKMEDESNKELREIKTTVSSSVEDTLDSVVKICNNIQLSRLPDIVSQVISQEVAMQIKRRLDLISLDKSLSENDRVKQIRGLARFFTKSLEEYLIGIARKKQASSGTDLRKEYKIALWSNGDYSCKECQKVASQVGRLKFRRRYPSETWNFFNIELFCEEHAS